MLQKFGLLTAFGVMLALAALVWIEPLTIAGQTVLAGLVFAIVTGIGSVVWRTRP